MCIYIKLFTILNNFHLYFCHIIFIFNLLVFKNLKFYQVSNYLSKNYNLNNTYYHYIFIRAIIVVTIYVDNFLKFILFVNFIPSLACYVYYSFIINYNGKLYYFFSILFINYGLTPILNNK